MGPVFTSNPLWRTLRKGRREQASSKCISLYGLDLIAGESGE